MAFIDCRFFSETLRLSVSMYVVLPEAAQKTRTDREGRCPALLLLHGLSDDHTIWMRRTSIERYASEKGMAVVMPAAGRSYYQDMASGPKYWTFIAQEVPRVARAFFPLSPARELNYVAGLSMGGYGALRVALTYPQSYAAAASLSGALDLVLRRERAVQDGAFTPGEMEGIFGPAAHLGGTPSDLFHLARQLAAAPGPKPRIYQYCGTNDFLYDDNIRFRDLARGLDLDVTYAEDDGTHAWSFWDQQIRRVLEWITPKE